VPRWWLAASSLALAGLALGAQAQERAYHSLGDFEYRVTANGILVGAPHGTSDAHTPEIVLEASRQLRSGYLIARRFFVNRVRINVNRPTEGAFLPCDEEVHSERAKEVYAMYQDLARKAAAGQTLRLYIDVHGNSNPKAAQDIHVATKGISAAEARRAKEAFPALLAKLRARLPDYPEIGLMMEPVDRVLYTAGCTKKHGVLGLDFVPRSLHLEFPRAAREGDNRLGSGELVAAIVRLLLEER